MGHPVERLLHLWVVLGGEEASGEHDRASGELVQWLERPGYKKKDPTLRSTSWRLYPLCDLGQGSSPF